MISGYGISENTISAEDEAWPQASPIDLSTAEINTDSVYTSNLFHFFALATATSSGVKDLVTGLLATTTGTVDIDDTVAGDGFVSLNPYGFTPATSVDDLTDQLTIVVVAKAQVINYSGFFGHLFSQHPAWFLTNKDYTSNQPRRFAVEAGGIEYTVDFADAGESSDSGLLHVYVGTYDGTAVRVYQDGYLVGELAASGTLTGQDAAHTRIGSYWGVTDGANLGATVQAICFGAAEAWNDAKVLGFMSDPWRNSLRAPSGSTPQYDVFPDAGSQSQAGSAPAVDVDFAIAPAKGTQVQTANAPTVDVDFAVTAAKGTQTQTGNAPGVDISFDVAPAKGTQAQTGNAPSVGISFAVAPAKGTQAQIGNAPGVSISFDVVPDPGLQLQFANAPSVDVTYAVVPAKGTQNQTGNSPSIGPIRSVEPAKGTQLQIGNTPTVALLFEVTPAKGTQTQIGNSPIVSSQDQVVPSAGRQTQTGNVVSISVAYSVVPDKGTQLQRGAASAALIQYQVAPVKAYQAQRGSVADIGFEPTVLPAHGAQVQTGSYEWPRDIIDVVVSADTSFVSMISADTSFLDVIAESTSIL